MGTKRDIDTIKMMVLHITLSGGGDLEEVKRWHTAPPPNGNGWSDIGYHYLIGNAYPTVRAFKARKPLLSHDGHIYRGRPLLEVGSHVRGHNTNSVGICCVGVDSVTGKQLDSLLTVIDEITMILGRKIPLFGHYELDPKKGCPNIDMDFLRDQLRLEHRVPYWLNPSPLPAEPARALR